MPSPDDGNDGITCPQGCCEQQVGECMGTPVVLFTVIWEVAGDQDPLWEGGCRCPQGLLQFKPPLPQSSPPLETNNKPRSPPPLGSTPSRSKASLCTAANARLSPPPPWDPPRQRAHSFEVANVFNAPGSRLRSRTVF